MIPETQGGKRIQVLTSYSQFSWPAAHTPHLYGATAICLEIIYFQYVVKQLIANLVGGGESAQKRPKTGPYTDQTGGVIRG